MEGSGGVKGVEGVGLTCWYVTEEAGLVTALPGKFLSSSTRLNEFPNAGTVIIIL